MSGPNLQVGALGSAHPIIVLVESASKKAPLSFALRKIGFQETRILIVGRELMSYRDDEVLGLDVALRETGRVPTQPVLIEHLRKECLNAPRVIIATDASPAGDTLANDLHSFVLNGHADVKRARMCSLDLETVGAGFNKLEGFNASDAWMATTRRMLDRLLGVLLPKPLGCSTVAVLSQMMRTEPPLGKVTLSLQAADGLDPFVAFIDVTANNVANAEALLRANMAFNDGDGVVEPGVVSAVDSPKPWSSNQAIINISQITGRTIEEVSTAMLRLYETGRLSYPCSNFCALSPAGIKWVCAIGNRNGLRIDPRKIPAMLTAARHDHESPRPTETNVDISTPVLLLNQEDAVLAILARHLITVAQPHRSCEPNPESLPTWAQGLGLKRQSTQWMNPWPRRRIRPSWEKTDLRAYALKMHTLSGLGGTEDGPKTVNMLASMDLFGVDFQLTERAKSMLDRVPSELRDPHVFKQMQDLIGAAFNKGEAHGSPQQLVKDLLDSFGLWRQAEIHLNR